MAAPHVRNVSSADAASAGSRPGAHVGLRGAVDRRLKRMREGMYWARKANARIVESYGNVVDLDLGWRMVDSTLQQHRAGQVELDADRLETLTDLWQTLTAEIISTPGRDEFQDADEVAREVGDAVRDRLQCMGDEMRRDERSAIRLMHDYETLVDLDLSWRMVEETLAGADTGALELEPELRAELQDRWRELTAELIAILGRHYDEISESPSQEALDNLFDFSRAA